MKSMFHLRSALSLALGIGSAITGSYLMNRVKEKQEVESRLDRIEAIVEKLATASAPAEKKPAGATPRRTAKSAARKK